MYVHADTRSSLRYRHAPAISECSNCRRFQRPRFQVRLGHRRNSRLPDDPRSNPARHFDVPCGAVRELMIRPLLPTRLLDGVFACGAIIAQSAFGVLLRCRRAVGNRRCLWGVRLKRIRTRLIALWDGCGSAFVFLRHRFLLRKRYGKENNQQFPCRAEAKCTTFRCSILGGSRAYCISVTPFPYEVPSCVSF